MKMEAQIQMINIANIMPNRFQPRLDADDPKIQELASSIRIHGIVQPLVIRRVQDKFEIVTGGRRLKAASILGLTAVPCIIVELDDTESAEISVVENIHSKDLTPIETAKNYKKILDKKYLNQQQLAERMAIDENSIVNTLKYLELDENVQTALQKNQISEKHARALLRLTDKMQQVNLLNDIIQNRLTVKQVDEKIDVILGNYNKKTDMSGGIQIDDGQSISTLGQNINSNNDLSITPTVYQYNSKIKDDDSKKSIFFNNLENVPVTMEDPTLSFGFNPFESKDIEPEETDGIIDLEDEDEIDLLDEPSEQTEEKKVSLDIYTPDELLKAIQDIIQQAQENGVEVKTEDFDFTNIYQLIIKIPKVEEEETNTNTETQGNN